MGVKGLTLFLEREKQHRTIEVLNKIKEWKRSHPGATPIVVIDFYNLAFRTGTHKCNVTANICSGVNQSVLNAWTKILTTLKACGCSLVFFVDLNVQEGKIELWLSRENAQFQTYKKVYDAIETGEFEKYRKSTIRVMHSTISAMLTIAKDFGEVHFTARHECDLKAAQYATHHSALAVVTADSDFLIYPGTWRYWSTLNIRRNGQMTALEFNREGLASVLGISQYQLPLLATLLVNDLTHQYSKQLSQFHKAMCDPMLSPVNDVVKNVARYVKKVGCVHLSDLDIKRITQDVLGKDDEKFQGLIRKSLNSYNIEYPATVIDDPVEEKLLNTDMYKTYMYFMGEIQDIVLDTYDMRGCKAQTNLTALLTDWAKRKTGLVRKRGEPYTFTLLTKKSFNEKYAVHKEEAIYPRFQLPPLDQLYIRNNESNNDLQMAEIRWNILAFIMSLSKNVVSDLRRLPKTYLLICTVLYELVKNGLLTIQEADVILYTEHKANSNGHLIASYPNKFIARFVRAAHIYDISFANVVENFAIAGLLPQIQVNPTLNGSYFHRAMIQTSKMNAEDRDSFLASIRHFRIYTCI